MPPNGRIFSPNTLQNILPPAATAMCDECEFPYVANENVKKMKGITIVIDSSYSNFFCSFSPSQVSDHSTQVSRDKLLRQVE